jgi:hypothetical protein
MSSMERGRRGIRLNLESMTIHVLCPFCSEVLGVQSKFHIYVAMYIYLSHFQIVLQNFMPSSIAVGMCESAYFTIHTELDMKM